MMYAISHGHVTRHMWTIIQAVYAWTYRWPKPHGFPSMVPSRIVILYNQRHILDNWACVHSFWVPQSDDTNLSVRTWVDLLNSSEGPLGWFWYFSPYTHNVTYFNVRRWVTPFGKLLEVDQILLWSTLSKVTCYTLAKKCQSCNNDICCSGSARSGNASKSRPVRKRPSIRTSIPSSDWEKGVNSMEFRHASTWASIVVSSLKVGQMSPTIHWKWSFKLFSTTSHSPPKCGACSGARLRWMISTELIDRAFYLGLFVVCVYFLLTLWQLPWNMYHNHSRLSLVSLVEWLICTGMLWRRLWLALTLLLSVLPSRWMTQNAYLGFCDHWPVNGTTFHHYEPGVIPSYLVKYHPWIQSVARKLPHQLQTRLACHTFTSYATMSDSAINPATSRDVEFLCQRCCHEHWTCLRGSRMLFLHEKSHELLFSWKDDWVLLVNSRFDRFSLPPTRRRPHWSRNGQSFKIFRLAASFFSAFQVEISCENSTSCVVLTQNISVSISSFSDKWSFIGSSWLTSELVTNWNIHA